MAGFQTLPVEIINEVFRYLESLQDLSSALQTCRHLRTSFLENPRVAADVMRRQFGPALLPYAIGVLEALRIDRKDLSAIQLLLDDMDKDLRMKPQYETDTESESESETETDAKSDTAMDPGLRTKQKSKFRERLQTEHLPNSPSTLEARLSTAPLHLLWHAHRMHEIILHFASEFAANAWDELKLWYGGPGLRECKVAVERSSLSLSTAEHIRFCRAYYRLELCYRLYRHDLDASPNEEDRVPFFSRMPIWEIEQMLCAQDFLEVRFAHKTREVMAHDVTFGEYRVNYLKVGFGNFRRQMWLSKGLAFLHTLFQQTAYDDIHAMLHATFEQGQSVDFTKMLYSYKSFLGLADDVNQTALKDCSEEVLVDLFQPSEPWFDEDDGPFATWLAANRYESEHWALMAYLMGGFRAQAYVFWDADRVDLYELVNAYLEDDHQPRAPLDRLEGYTAGAEMEQSFEARSKIWNSGGRGYWSKGDESRIVWKKLWWKV